MKIACYQMDIYPADPKKNRQKVEQWLHTISRGDDCPDIAVLPEMWTTAYTLPELNEVAEDEKKGNRAVFKAASS